MVIVGVAMGFVALVLFGSGFVLAVFGTWVTGGAFMFVGAGLGVMAVARLGTVPRAWTTRSLLRATVALVLLGSLLCCLGPESGQLIYR